MQNKKTFEMQDAYTGKLYGSTAPPTKRIMIGIPMTGLLRAEWVIARYGQVIPCNWSQTDALRWLSTEAPLNYMVADARNSIVNAMIEEEFEWLLFIDHDVIIPPDTVIRINQYILDHNVPVVSGLYFTKSVPSEPLIYRGRGNSYYSKWKMGDKVWVDGIPMGCTLIHSSLLKVMWDDAEEYEYMGRKIRRVFETPARTWYDPESMNWYTSRGTEDLNWCTKVMDGGYLKKAGWPEIQRKKYPFLLDTGIFCRHIDFSGNQYPSRGEELKFKGNI